MSRNCLFWQYSVEKLQKKSISEGKLWSTENIFWLPFLVPEFVFHVFLWPRSWFFLAIYRREIDKIVYFWETEIDKKVLHTCSIMILQKNKSLFLAPSEPYGCKCWSVFYQLCCQVQFFENFQKLNKKLQFYNSWQIWKFVRLFQKKILLKI